MGKKISLKEINRLAIPAIFAGIVEPLISLTDTAVAGRLPHHPDEAIAAIGLVGSFLSAMVWIFAQTSNALSAIVAQGYGKKQIQRIKPLVSQVFFFNFIVGALLSVVIFFLQKEIILLYGAEEELLEISLRYFRIRVWGFPITLLTLTLFGIFRGVQNTSWAMKTSFVGGFLNVVLDVIFVFVFDLNVEGIAYASLIAQFTMLVIAITYLFYKTPFKLQYIFPLHERLKQTLTMGLDLFLRAVSLNFGLFMAFRFATQLGEGNDNKYVATHAILLQIWLFSAFLLDGFASAGNAISGKLLGASDYARLRYLVKDLVKIMFGVGCGVMLIYLLLYYPIGRSLTDSQEILTVFYATFWLVVFMQPLNAISFLFDGVYKGLGETVVLRNVFIIAVFVIFIPCLYLFDYLNLGIKGIWISFYVWMIARSTGLIFHFKQKYWTTR